MKLMLLTIAGSLVMLFASVSFADCCGGSTSYCDPYDNSCQCAEPSCGKNPCLSRSDCCYAFGNIGAR